MDRPCGGVDHDVLELPTHPGGLSLVGDPERQVSVPSPSRCATVQITVYEYCRRLFLQIRSKVYSRRGFANTTFIPSDRDDQGMSRTLLN